METEVHHVAPKKDAEQHAPPKKLGGQKRSSGLFEFANVEAIKERVRVAKLKPEPYNVHNMYHDKGVISMIAKHPVFENTTLSIIVINAFWIYIDTDYNKAETIDKADVGFVVADSLFFTYFSIELIIRFLAFKKKRDCLCDGWFVFDSALVGLYAFDPFVLGIIAAASGGGGLDLPTAVLRLFRLARLSRLVRMLRSLPELMILIKGMISAVPSVSYAIFLLGLIAYIFAIAIRNLCDKESDLVAPDGFFETVPEAIHSLIIFATFYDDFSAFVYPIKDESTVLFIVCWLYVILAGMTVMNMLIGVLCAVIDSVAEEERESMIVEKVNDKFTNICAKLDTDKDGSLSWDEFEKILDYPEAIAALEKVKVDPEVLVEAAEEFFWDEGVPLKLSFTDFMLLVLDLRGGNPVTVKDTLSVAKRATHKYLRQQRKITAIEETCDKILDHLQPGASGQWSAGSPTMGAGSSPPAMGLERRDSRDRKSVV